LLANDQLKQSEQHIVQASLIAIVGLICAAAFAIGFGLLIPVSSVVGDFFDVFAGGSAIFFVGLLEGEQHLKKIINRSMVFEPEGPQARRVVLY
jgi:hypothetical protein